MEKCYKKICSNCHSFEPIIDKNSKILILGSMPGRESLAKHQYYGNSRNSFWKIIFTIFNYSPTDNYEQKKALLSENHIALWDVIESCQREGSLDSNIRNPTINDFNWLLQKYPNIKRIYFNGKTSQKLFEKFVINKIKTTDISFYSLPSTSPAHNTITFEQKLEKWRDIQNI